MSFDWKKIVASVAPMLGAALGGPLGGMAGTVLGNLLGVDPSDPKALEKAVLTAPLEKLEEIRKADADFKLQMEKLGFENEQALERLAKEDRDSARKREVDTGDNLTPRVLAALIVSGFLFCIYWAISGRVQGLHDPVAVGFIGTLFGYVSAKADLVYAYYFGSSSQSRYKTGLIYDSIPNKNGGK